MIFCNQDTEGKFQPGVKNYFASEKKSFRIQAKNNNDMI